MNQRMIPPNERRYQTDPLFAAQCDKRCFEHQIKMCREERNRLQCSLKKLDEDIEDYSYSLSLVNKRIEKLEEEN